GSASNPEFLNTVFLWDVTSRKELRKFEVRFTDFRDTGASVTFSPDGRFLACGGGDNKVRLYEVVTAEKVLELAGHRERVASAVFTPDGRTLVSSSFDATLRWD